MTRHHDISTSIAAGGIGRRGTLAGLLGAVALGAVAALALPQSAQAEGALDQIKERGELRMAGVVYRPFIFKRPTGEYAGIDVDVMTMVAEELGVRLNVIDAGWDTAVAGITTGRWDIVPATCITPARLEVVDFTESYLMLGGVFVALADNPKGFAAPEDFDDADVTIAVPTGAWSESIAREAAPNATLRAFGQTTSPELLQEVLSGRADAVVLDAPVQTSMAQATFGDRLAFYPSATEPMEVLPCRVGYAHAKGDEAFSAFLNEVIETNKDTGHLQELFDVWLVPEHISPEN